MEVSKVKMDVIKPWIANRVTELLGFEDEVLINFIYGLLDGKVTLHFLLDMFSICRKSNSCLIYPFPQFCYIMSITQL